jgi:hypothetical protein
VGGDEAEAAESTDVVKRCSSQASKEEKPQNVTVAHDLEQRSDNKPASKADLTQIRD